MDLENMSRLEKRRTHRIRKMSAMATYSEGEQGWFEHILICSRSTLYV